MERWTAWRNKARRTTLILALTAAALLAAERVPSAQPAGAPPGEVAAYRFVGNVVRITMTAPDGSEGEQGYGFVFGERNGKLLVVTADHVLRPSGVPGGKAGVSFSDTPYDILPGRILDLRVPPDKGDLAVMEVPRPPGFHAVWPALVPSYGLQPGTRAWRIGKAGRWVPASKPGSFVGRHGPLLLEFDDLDTPKGSSGGPVINEQGLIGMVVEDGGLFGAPARVLPTEIIVAMLGEWHLPWKFPPAYLPDRSPAETLLPQQPAPLQPAASPGAGSGFPFSATDLRQKAIYFITNHYARWSGPNDPLDAYLASTYGNDVDFFGKMTSRSIILPFKHRYMLRWPVRRYVLRTNSLATTCGADRICAISGTVDWDYTSPERGEHKFGYEVFTFKIAFIDGRAYITGENTVTYPQ